MVVINGKEKAAVVAEGMSGMAQRDTMMQQRRAEREAKRKQKEDEQNEENRKEVSVVCGLWYMVYGVCWVLWRLSTCGLL